MQSCLVLELALSIQRSILIVVMWLRPTDSNLTGMHLVDLTMRAPLTCLLLACVVLYNEWVRSVSTMYVSVL